MKKSNLSSFYSDERRLSYNPVKKMNFRRSIIKRLAAFDDRFLCVSTFLNEIIKTNKEEKIRILDIGIGDAVYESRIPEELFGRVEVFGVDISKDQLRRARRYLKVSKVVNLDGERLPFKSNFFDIVLVSEILEHLFWPNKAVGEAERVVKKGGYLILTYPNSGALQLRLSLLLRGSSPLLNFPKNQEHIRFFIKRDVMSFFTKDIKIIHYQGLGSLLFADWNFGLKIVFPRFLQILGNKFLPQLALGNLMILKK